jgi:hypothetical protein
MHAGRQGGVGVQDWGRRGVESSVPSCKQILFTGSTGLVCCAGGAEPRPGMGKEKVDDITVVPRDVEYLHEK